MNHQTLISDMKENTMKGNHRKKFTLRGGKTYCNHKQHMNLCRKGQLRLCDLLKISLKLHNSAVTSSKLFFITFSSSYTIAP